MYALLYSILKIYIFYIYIKVKFELRGIEP